MWNLVELRKREPELFEDLEVQQQPSSNVDSVVLTWSVQDEALRQAYSVWNRDSFSAIFSEPVVQTQKIASQFSAILLGKVTQKIQLTDTDFAALFKTDFRRSMSELQYAAGGDGMLKITIREILSCCASAHKAAVQRNAETEWVVKGAVRNGLLVYIPAEKGLVPLLSEKLQMGSHRIPSETFQPRLSWLEEDGSGRPKKPDFTLSGKASQLQDFIEWSFQNPVQDEPEDQLDIQGPLEDDLEIPLQNALYLRLSPSLRHDMSRAKLDVTFTQLLEKAKLASEKKKEKKEQRTALRKLNLKELQARLKKMSKLEAMAEVKPSVVTKKKLQKRGAVKKKKKKTKVKKKLKKSVTKQNLEKDAKKQLEKEKLEVASESAPIEDGTAAEKVSAAAKASAKGRGKARGRGRGRGAAAASAKGSEGAADASAKNSEGASAKSSFVASDPVSVRVVAEEAKQVYYGCAGEVESEHLNRGLEEQIQLFNF